MPDVPVDSLSLPPPPHSKKTAVVGRIEEQRLAERSQDSIMKVGE
jgi:hypothetical protein